jgi:iron complex transport system permease protein
MKRFDLRIGAAITVFLIACMTLLALTVGSAQIQNIWQIIFNPSGQANTSGYEIIWQIRAPRIAAALLVGAALGVAGVMAQGATNNPLAEPAILGTSAGAALATVIAILTGIATIGSPLALVAGVLGALGATLLTYRLATSRRTDPQLKLVIIGIAVSATISAAVGLLTTMTSRADARSISFWNFGSLSLVSTRDLATLAIFIATGMMIAFFIAPSLDVLSLGDAPARHRGLDPRRTRMISLFALAIVVAATVGTVGTIAFLGLAIPHIARFIYGPRNRALVLQSALLGALILLIADTLARTISSSYELPIGLVTSLLGAPILIALITRRSAMWKI